MQATTKKNAIERKKVSHNVFFLFVLFFSNMNLKEKSFEYFQWVKSSIVFLCNDAVWLFGIVWDWWLAIIDFSLIDK